MFVACVLYETPELEDEDAKWRAVMFCSPIHSVDAAFAANAEHGVHGHEPSGSRWSVLTKTIVYSTAVIDGNVVAAHMPHFGDETFVFASVDTAEALLPGGNEFDCIEGPEVTTDPAYFNHAAVLVSEVVDCDETPQRVHLSWHNNHSQDDLTAYMSAYELPWTEETEA